MSDQSGAAARDNSRDLPDRLSLRHSKLKAKRRLAAGEFTTLHDAQLAVAREHGMSSWAGLKEHIAAAEAEHGHALAQVRWVFDRYSEADEAGWTAPSGDELSEHFTEQFLVLVPPKAAAALLRSVAPKLREELVLIDAGPLHLRAKVADLLVEADVEPETPHRLTSLRVSPGGAPATDRRVTQPPVASFGPVPEQVPGFVEGSYTELGAVGLISDLTGTSFAQAATRLVLEPLGMADSWFPTQAPVSPDVTRGYRLAQDGSLVPEPLPVFAFQSAGGLWSTGPDLVRFGSGWRRLLPGELAEQALRPHARQFDSAAEIGLGWLLSRPDDVAGQAGAGPGASVSLITRPSTGRTSVVLTNRQVLVEPTNARLIRSAT